MIFLLLPFIFNPFSFAIRWLPALYLAAWPIIIQTLGRDALITHAIVLILFILVCDITRETMLKLIGIDLISLPTGVALLAVLLTEKGFTFLSMITPIFSGLLVLAEPIFLFIETFIIMEMIRNFNRWISSLSNIRDENSQDLSSWEPPLTRASITVRFVVVLIAIASYIATYMIIQESKALLGHDVKEVPIQFNHAIAMLVTLQLISLSATIYKEEGILSETAIVALVASVPIFIASWSYYHLKATSISSSSTWQQDVAHNRDDFSLTSAGSDRRMFGFDAKGRLVFGDYDATSQQETFGANEQLDFGALEQSLNLIAPSDSFLKQLLLAFLRRLIMIINSILGLSIDRLAKYYFGPDFWYILAGRLVCLVWWTLFGGRSGQANSSDEVDFHDSDEARTLRGSAGWLWDKFRRLPINKPSLIKVLLVLAYAQMIIQQMENRHNLATHTSLLAGAASQAALDSAPPTGPCCARQPDDGQDLINADQGSASGGAGLADWFSCMWTSARACSANTAQQQQRARTSGARLLELTTGLLGQLFGFVLSALVYLYERLANVHALIYSAWLARWRSPIIQRLIQSILVHVCYINSLMFAREHAPVD